MSWSIFNKKGQIAGRSGSLRLFRAVVLAAGSGLASLHGRFGITGAPPLVRALNLLLDRPGRDIAMVAPASHLSRGRMLTAVPWGGGTLVGTDPRRSWQTAGKEILGKQIGNRLSSIFRGAIIEEH